MRTIIAGCRDFYNYDVVVAAIQAAEIQISTVLSGAAKGVDSLGAEWARKTGVPVEEYPADWFKFGKSAGPRRNKEMVDKAEALIALWDYQSIGTRDVINKAKAKGLKVFIFDISRFR